MPRILAGWFFARIFDGKCMLRPERLWRVFDWDNQRRKGSVSHMGIVGTDSGENDDFVDSCMFFQPDGG